GFAAHEACALVVREEAGRWRAPLAGLGLGLTLLGRQWGFFLLPAVAALALDRIIRAKGRRVSMSRQAAVAGATCALVGGWFYAHLAIGFGTPKAFGRGGSRAFSLSNQPPEFFTGLGLDKLFTD